MADEGQLGKLKEQYVDDILNIVPLSQACFIVLMVIAYDQLSSGATSSALDSLANFGFKTTLGPDEGRFWKVGFLPIFIVFGLALLNMYLLRSALSRSLRKANVGSSLGMWAAAAQAKVAGLDDTQKLAIHGSLKPEIENRLKRFKGKRLSTELIASVMSVVLYANALLIFFAAQDKYSLRWDWSELGFIIISFSVCVMLHRGSIRYAIAKVLPLKVFSGVLSGELIFFEEISA